MMTKNIYNMGLALVLTLAGIDSANADCVTGCTQTITTASSNSTIYLSSGKLCIPTGITFTGTVFLSGSGTVENCGSVTGTIDMSEGTLINNNILNPEKLIISGGEFRNYGTVDYQNNLNVKNAMILNEGEIDFGSLLLASSDLSICNGGSMIVTNLDINDGKIILCSASDELEVEGNTKISSDASLVSNGQLSFQKNVDLEGEMTINEDVLFSSSLSINKNGMLTLADSTRLSVIAHFDINDGVLNSSGTVFVQTRFKSDGSVFLFDNAILYANTMLNQGLINGSGVGRICVRVAEHSVNKGVLNGRFDFCDSTGNYFDVQNGTVGEGISNCLCGAVLPVSWLSFRATKDGNNVSLNWSTASEWNNSHFVVESSIDGKSWAPIARVIGSGTTTSVQNYDYSYTLPTISPRIYYRIQQVDFDGKTDFSTVVILSFDKAGLGTMVLGNPFDDKLSLVINSTSEINVTVQLININGQVIISETKNLETGANSVSLSTAHLRNGVYFLKVIQEGISAETIKVIK